MHVPQNCQVFRILTIIIIMKCGMLMMVIEGSEWWLWNEEWCKHTIQVDTMYTISIDPVRQTGMF